MKRFVASILSVAMALSAFPSMIYANQTTNAVTQTTTFPQVQSYNVTDGSFTIGTKSRFYIVESESTLNNQRLYDDVKLISSEFAVKGIPSNNVLDIVIGPENKAKSGDIIIAMETVKETNNPEGYKIDVKQNGIKITAPNEKALFYGMRTVEKALVGNDKKMAQGTIVDYPEVSVRSFHLDLARKYFTVDWIKSMIKDLSYQNISSMQIHFSENEGFRLQSDVLENAIPNFEYPKDANGNKAYYTKEEMKDIIATANKYHIEIFPSFDTPGHLGYVLNQLKEKASKDYTVANLFPNDSRKNQTFNIFESNEAKQLLLDLMDEFAKFFSDNGATRMNIGGDEFLANFTQMSNEQYKSVINYFNEAAKVVKKYNMIPRAWNDGLLVEGYTDYKLDSDIEICYWGLGTGSAPIKDFVANGNKLVNYVDAFMYYALSQWWMDFANAKGEKIFTEWHSGKMNGLPGGVSQDFSKPYPNDLLGASYALWCDDPNFQTEEEIANQLFMRTRAMADRAWNARDEKPEYAQFEQFVTKVGRVPGYNNEQLPPAKDVVNVDDIVISGDELSTLTLPVVQSYQVDNNTQSFKVDENTRLVLPKTQEYLNNTRLQEILDLVSAELLEKKIPTNKEINKVYALDSQITNNDIVVTIDRINPITDKSNSDQAYKIVIGENGVKITAASETAALYALRTIEQLMITNNNSLNYGTIIDYPNLQERRVHVDMARKYITKDWLIQHVRQLSYFKMNALQLHFSENLGFRIECETDPAIVSKDGFLTKDEIREVLAEARKYGVNIIPSLDTPGHVEHILKIHPEFGQVNINGEHSKVALDITNEKAINYIRSIYKEYMDLFKGCTDFHIGGDEFMEFDRPPFTTEYRPVLNEYAVKKYGEGYTWKDTVAGYINELAEFVYSQGFKPRIWNDGIYYGEKSTKEQPQKIEMHKYIGIDFWSQMAWNKDIANLQTFIDKGHKDIYNVNASFFYYVLRPSAPDDGRPQHSFDYKDQDIRIFDEWTPGKFQENTIDDNSEVIKGASLAIWCDKPDLVSEDVITTDISKELRSLATKSWNTSSNSRIDINGFRENYNKLGDVAGFAKGSELPKVSPLKEVIDYSELNAVINQANSLKQSDYTTESFNNFKSVLNDAKALVNNAKTQKEVDDMVAKLKDAISKLQLNGVNGNNNVQNPNIANTSDNFAMNIAIIVLLLSASGILISFVKRKNKI